MMTRSSIYFVTVLLFVAFIYSDVVHTQIRFQERDLVQRSLYSERKFYSVLAGQSHLETSPSHSGVRLRLTGAGPVRIRHLARVELTLCEPGTQLHIDRSGSSLVLHKGSVTVATNGTTDEYLIQVPVFRISLAAGRAAVWAAAQGAAEDSTRVRVLRGSVLLSQDRPGAPAGPIGPTQEVLVTPTAVTVKPAQDALPACVAEATR